jgi:uncharacterized cupredoxin-like copper-binding protein
MAVLNSSTTFSIVHIAMMCRYVGVGLMVVAMGQYFEGNKRSWIMAGIGIALFILGHVMEYFTSESRVKRGVLSTVLLGSLLAVGVGLFIGGLLQFAVRPEQSVWLVPLGGALSLLGLVFSLDKEQWGHWKSYTLVAMALIGAGSLVAYQYFTQSQLGLGYTTINQPTPTPHIVNLESTPLPVPTTNTVETQNSTTQIGTGSAAFAKALPPKVMPSIDQLEAQFESLDEQTKAVERRTDSNDMNSNNVSVLTPDMVVAQAAQRDQLEAIISTELTAQSVATSQQSTPTPTPEAALAINSSTPATIMNEDAYSAPSAGQQGDSAKVARTIEINILDTLRYDPNRIMVPQHEHVKFVLHNNSLVKQDWTLGRAVELREFAKQRVLDPELPINTLLTLEPNQTKEVIWEFTEAGNVAFASLQSGHYKVGLVGQVIVLPR